MVKDEDENEVATVEIKSVVVSNSDNGGRHTLVGDQLLWETQTVLL